MKKEKIKNKNVLIIAVVIIVSILCVIMYIENSVINKNVKKAVEDMECVFYKIESSKEKDFSKDIYISIPREPVESYSYTNQSYYENLIKVITSQLNNTNYRLIDEEKELVIRVKADNKNVKYTINGDNNYYQTKIAELSFKNTNEEKTINLEIKSSELDGLINEDWNRANIRNILGSIDDTENQYECYVDEGYKIRIVNLKVFNIVFTDQYQGEVFSEIRTGLSNLEVQEKLGNPIFVGEEKEVIGYKTEQYYVFFYNGEISIYRIEELNEDDNQKFASLVTELLNKNDLDKFISDVTDLYHDYDEFIQDENRIKLSYALRGFEINYQKDGYSGITIYNNYKGKITDEISVEDIKNGKALPSKIYSGSIDKVFEYELKK